MFSACLFRAGFQRRTSVLLCIFNLIAFSNIYCTCLSQYEWNARTQITKGFDNIEDQPSSSSLWCKVDTRLNQNLHIGSFFFLMLCQWCIFFQETDHSYSPIVLYPFPWKLLYLCFSRPSCLSYVSSVQLESFSARPHEHFFTSGCGTWYPCTSSLACTSCQRVTFVQFRSWKLLIPELAAFM